MPITVSPEPEIVSASARLIASHKYPNLRILMQVRFHIINTNYSFLSYNLDDLNLLFQV